MKINRFSSLIILLFCLAAISCGKRDTSSGLVRIDNIADEISGQ